MRGYIIRRALATIPVMLMVATVVFLLLHITPGDPVSVILGDASGQEVRLEDIKRVREQLGLDRPILVQYLDFIGNVARGNFGKSIFSQKPISELMRQRLPASISLGALAQLLAVSLAIPLGVMAAWKANTIIDRVVMVFAVLGFSIPSFWLAYNLIWLFAVRWQWFPATGYSSLSEGIGPWASHLVLPVVAIGVISAALTARITRATMLEVLREDYIRTARSKGLAENVVLFRHALKNAAIPIVTIIGVGLATLITGIVVIEVVFAIPGMGRLLVDGILKRDFPVIQSVVLVAATAYVVINLAIDILYAYLDPRIRY